MRRCLCAVLLSCFLALSTAGSLTAGDLNANHANQLLAAAKEAKPNGEAGKATLSLGGKDVIFTVTRDAVGNVTATPVAGPDSAGITVALVKIQFQADSDGRLIPTSLTVISTSQTITSYAFTLNKQEGTIASLYQPGKGGGGGEASKTKPVVGGIGGASGSLKDEQDLLTKDKFPGFTEGQLGLPPGTKPGEVRREASPSAP